MLVAGDPTPLVVRDLLNSAGDLVAASLAKVQTSAGRDLHGLWLRPAGDAGKVSRMRQCSCGANPNDRPDSLKRRFGACKFFKHALPTQTTFLSTPG